MIIVSASLPGADPATVASPLAAPLERRLGQIAGVSEITSVSTLGGAGITIQFDLNRNVDGAARDVQAAINAAAGDLPINLPDPPTYRKVNPADAPIMILAHDLGHPAGHGRSSNTATPSSASGSARSKASARCSSAAPTNPPSASRSTRRPWPPPA